MVRQPEPEGRNWKTVTAFIGIFTTKMAQLYVRVDIIAAQYKQLSWRAAEEMPLLWDFQTGQNLSVTLGHQNFSQKLMKERKNKKKLAFY